MWHVGPESCPRARVAAGRGAGFVPSPLGSVHCSPAALSHEAPGCKWAWSSWGQWEKDVYISRTLAPCSLSRRV